MAGPAPVIRFLHKPEWPFALDGVRGVCAGGDLQRLFSTDDQALIDEAWGDAEKLGCYTQPGALGSLWDSSDVGRLVFRSTEYRAYFAACRYSPARLNPAIYDAMRVGSVGSVVRSADGRILIHRRAADAAHLPGRFDCSAAGLCPVGTDGALDFRAALLEKLGRELALGGADVGQIDGVGIHSIAHPSWSGMVTFRVETPLPFATLEQRINRRYLDGAVGIAEEHLADWIVDNLLRTGELLADGAATLLAALPHRVFRGAVDAIRAAGGIVRFGRVRAGTFVEEPSS